MSHFTLFGLTALTAIIVLGGCETKPKSNSPFLECKSSGCTSSVMEITNDYE